MRIHWVDQAKGIGILLVVLAHTDLDYGWVGKYINSFHMPLFFLLSGFLFQPDKVESFRAYARKRSIALLVPYFAFALLSVLYFLLRSTYGNPEYYKDLDAGTQLLGVFYSAGTREWMDFNLPLWFLTCLFVVEMLYYGLRKLIRKPALLALALLAISLLAYADGLWNPYKLPWGIDVALTAVVFYGAGNMLRASLAALMERPWYIKLSAAIACAGLNAAFVQIRVNLNMKVHGDYFVFYGCAFAGIAACLLLSSLVRSPVLSFFGKHAIVVMAMHMPVLNIVEKVNERLGLFHGYYAREAADAAMAVLLLVPAILLVNAYAPFLAGKGLAGWRTPPPPGPGRGRKSRRGRYVSKSI